MNTPLLLSGPTKIIRDAARAAKRTVGLAMERVTVGTLSTLLGLPGMVVTEYALEKQGEREVLHIFCDHEQEVGICPRCGRASTAVHEREERCIRHLEMWGKATFVHFWGRRFDCGHCQQPFTEELSWLESKRRESNAYELHVYEQCKHTDQAAVAAREGLHPETVKLIFQRWRQQPTK
jgi:transposase